MKNFPAITRADEVTLKIDSSEQLVRSVTGNSAAFLVTVIVPPMEVGVYEVSVSSSRYSYLGDLRFDLLFEAHPPAFQSVRPSTGSMEGSDIVDVKIVYMTPIASPNDVTVGSEDVTWHVDEIVYNDSSGTYIRVVAPPSAKAGRIDVLVTQKLTQEKTVYFQYQYIDNSFTVLTPGAECLARFFMSSSNARITPILSSLSRLSFSISRTQRKFQTGEALSSLCPTAFSMLCSIKRKIQCRDFLFLRFFFFFAKKSIS
jgi:hypothetical protein